MANIGDDFGKVPTGPEIVKMLFDHEMREHDGILEQDLSKGETMQVRLGEDKIHVYLRNVGPGATESEWNDVTGYQLAEWKLNSSPVWHWLRYKGIDEVQLTKKMLGLN